MELKSSRLNISIPVSGYRPQEIHPCAFRACQPTPSCRIDSLVLSSSVQLFALLFPQTCVHLRNVKGLYIDATETAQNTSSELGQVFHGVADATPIDWSLDYRRQGRLKHIAEGHIPVGTAYLAVYYKRELFGSVKSLDLRFLLQPELILLLCHIFVCRLVSVAFVKLARHLPFMRPGRCLIYQGVDLRIRQALARGLIIFLFISSSTERGPMSSDRSFLSELEKGTFKVVYWAGYVGRAIKRIKNTKPIDPWTARLRKALLSRPWTKVPYDGGYERVDIATRGANVVVVTSSSGRDEMFLRCRIGVLDLPRLPLGFIGAYTNMGDALRPPAAMSDRVLRLFEAIRRRETRRLGRGRRECLRRAARAKERHHPHQLRVFQLSGLFSLLGILQCGAAVILLIEIVTFMWANFFNHIYEDL